MDWQLDKSTSYARMTITPILEKGRRYYLITTEVKINPYPNPFGIGGWWGQQVAESEDEIERIIKEEKAYLERWRECGMEMPLEVIREPEKTLTEWRNDRLRESGKQVQLRLFDD